jgi:hypothetical protein
MPDDLPQLRRRHQALAARLGQIGFALSAWVMSSGRPDVSPLFLHKCRKSGCLMAQSAPSAATR